MDMNQNKLFLNCRSSEKDHENPESSHASSYKKRTRITPYQRVQLENKFMISAYISKSDQVLLSMELRLPCKTVQAWFKNRRYRWRKGNCSTYNQDTCNDKQPEATYSPVQPNGMCCIPIVPANTVSVPFANQTPSLYTKNAMNLGLVYPNICYDGQFLQTTSNHPANGFF